MNLDGYAPRAFGPMRAGDLSDLGLLRVVTNGTERRWLSWTARGGHRQAVDPHLGHLVLTEGALHFLDRQGEVVRTVPRGWWPRRNKAFRALWAAVEAR